MPVFLGPEGTGALVLKLPKEAILAARLNNEVKVYLLSDGQGLASHLGVVTAMTQGNMMHKDGMKPGGMMPGGMKPGGMMSQNQGRVAPDASATPQLAAMQQRMNAMQQMMEQMLQEQKVMMAPPKS